MLGYSWKTFTYSHTASTVIILDSKKIAGKVALLLEGCVESRLAGLRQFVPAKCTFMPTTATTAIEHLLLTPTYLEGSWRAPSFISDLPYIRPQKPMEWSQNMNIPVSEKESHEFVRRYFSDRLPELSQLAGRLHLHFSYGKTPDGIIRITAFQNGLPGNDEEAARSVSEALSAYNGQS
ncbi:uncharacterized protein B0I36DRAFT_334376 [Microdochium trichocladiopsis]|uniref:Uncharacterized protein n=1 Tax=Microdochium trichocladiopsis TaxID=1682393 RepID=A0A9P8XZI1_9PEZI|nr:uncharacterized protein B0I36DRAFT_334376 [Microdochium trichocladiopsis]KAH7021399.1 hypothetical protein B0I36DRAFT_334376 [Microdochium trichocladiopsis]